MQQDEIIRYLATQQQQFEQVRTVQEHQTNTLQALSGTVTAVGTSVETLANAVAIVTNTLRNGGGGGGGGGGDPRQGRGRYNKPPKYKGGADKTSWETFKAQWKAFSGLLYGNNPTVEQTAELKASIFLNITEDASQLLTGLGPGSDTFNAATTVNDYLGVLTNVYRPAAEISLAKQKFRARKQQPKEAVQYYHSVKKRLFETAYPEDFVANRHSVFIEEFSDGLHNDAVFSNVRDHAPYNTAAEVLNQALKAVATERLAVAQGRKRDAGGLGTALFQSDADEPNLGARAHDKPEAMDLSMIEEEVHQLIDQDPQQAEDLLSEHLANLQLAGTFNGTCWSCGEFGHSSKFCKRKKTTTWRNGRGAGGAGRGGATGGTANKTFKGYPRAKSTSLPRRANGQFLPAGVYTKKAVNQFFDETEGGAVEDDDEDEEDNREEEDEEEQGN